MIITIFILLIMRMMKRKNTTILDKSKESCRGKSKLMVIVDNVVYFVELELDR